VWADTLALGVAGHRVRAADAAAADVRGGAAGARGIVCRGSRAAGTVDTRRLLTGSARRAGSAGDAAGAAGVGGLIGGAQALPLPIAAAVRTARAIADALSIYAAPAGAAIDARATAAAGAIGCSRLTAALTVTAVRTGSARSVATTGAANATTVAFTDTGAVGLTDQAVAAGVSLHLRVRDAFPGFAVTDMADGTGRRAGAGPAIDMEASIVDDVAARPAACLRLRVGQATFARR
jgi:hypothetical protein